MGLYLFGWYHVLTKWDCAFLEGTVFGVAGWSKDQMGLFCWRVTCLGKVCRPKSRALPQNNPGFSVATDESPVWHSLEPPTLPWVIPCHRHVGRVRDLGQKKLSLVG